MSLIQNPKKKLYKKKNTTVPSFIFWDFLIDKSKESVLSVSSSPQTSAPKFEWCDSLLRFGAIFYRNPEVKWFFFDFIEPSNNDVDFF